MAIASSKMSTRSSSGRRRFRRPFLRAEAPLMREMIAAARLELIPMKSLDGAIDELHAHSAISMTCSPAKSIEATLDESARLIAAGHRVVPHIAARMVATPDHLTAIHQRLGELGIREIFVVGGDADPPGCFFDAIEFIDAFVQLDDAAGAGERHVDHIGFTAYPDSHPVISEQQLHDALHTKQRLILDSGRTAHVTTQMCFSADQIRTWATTERAAGLTIPIHLGIPGVIDKTKLMTMGMRLGVGTSLRYLTKNKRAISALMTQRSFEPDSLLRPLAADLEPLGISGIHLFTFNQVATTEAWRQRTLA